MWIGLHLQTDLLRGDAAAPALAESEEKLLNWRVAILILGQVDALPLGIRQESDIGQSQAAVVGGVLAQSQLAIHLHVIHSDKIAVLLHLAVCLFFKLLGIVRRPPVCEVSVAIVLSPLIVETMR